jgi:hypothetical protein
MSGSDKKQKLGKAVGLSLESQNPYQTRASTLDHRQYFDERAPSS